MKNKVSSWKVGDVKITRIIEGERAGPMFAVPDAIPENIIKVQITRSDEQRIIEII